MLVYFCFAVFTCIAQNKIPSWGTNKVKIDWFNPLETTQQRTKNPSEHDNNHNTLQTAHNTPLTA